MAPGDQTKPGPATSQSSEKITGSDDDSEPLIPNNGAPADDVPQLEPFGHESPGDVGESDSVGQHDEMGGQEEAGVHTEAGEMSEQHAAGTSIAAGDAFDDFTAYVLDHFNVDDAGLLLELIDTERSITNELTSPNQPPNNKGTGDTNPQSTSPKKTKPADQFPKFLRLPAELRLKVWEQAFLEEGFRFHAPFPRGSIQRFRFDLRYDPSRVKPGKDESRGWVACFTPLHINTRPYFKFLRASYESRKHMMDKAGMSTLTVHELRRGDDGQPVGSPRKCHMPFDFGRDVFCLEGISHGVEKGSESWRTHKGGDHAAFVCSPPLAEILDNALGLRFAPRIKRLAIIPHHEDALDQRCNRGRFIENNIGKDMATLAKRFPSLVSVRSAIPQSGCRDIATHPPEGCDSARYLQGYFQWHGADLRGRSKGGPTGMSEEERNELYRRAWQRLFDSPFYTCCRRLKGKLYDDGVCVVRRSKGKLHMVCDVY